MQLRVCPLGPKVFQDALFHHLVLPRVDVPPPLSSWMSSEDRGPWCHFRLRLRCLHESHPLPCYPYGDRTRGVAQPWCVVPPAAPCRGPASRQKYRFAGGSSTLHLRPYLGNLDRGSVSSIPTTRNVAQPGSAPEWGSGGRGFKSHRSDWVSTYLLTELLTNLHPEGVNNDTLQVLPHQAVQSNLVHWVD